MCDAHALSGFTVSTVAPCGPSCQLDEMMSNARNQAQPVTDKATTVSPPAAPLAATSSRLLRPAWIHRVTRSTRATCRRAVEARRSGTVLTLAGLAVGVERGPCGWRAPQAPYVTLDDHSSPGRSGSLNWMMTLRAPVGTDIRSRRPYHRRPRCLRPVVNHFCAWQTASPCAGPVSSLCVTGSLHARCECQVEALS